MNPPSHMSLLPPSCGPSLGSSPDYKPHHSLPCTPTTHQPQMAANGVNGHGDLPALHTTPEDFLKHDYDFIIIGGGTAGLVVAARLTENEDLKGGRRRRID